MSTPLAIASVTQVLKDLLNDGLVENDATGAIGGSVTVSALPPDRAKPDSAEEDSRLNLFMYLVTYNSGWRNEGLPSRNSAGERTANPLLALDLHYLLTAYGAKELHAEMLLGLGMLVFHENPVLARDAIRDTLRPVPAGSLTPDLAALAASRLADQIELIKITPESLNTEELSRLWTAFGAKYRPHAAYKATVVLIESRKKSKSALPVQQRNLYVVPFRQPVIEKISSQAAANQPVSEDQKVFFGYNLVIDGYQLQGESTVVTIDGREAPPTSVTDTRIVVAIPANVPAGVHAVQVVHKLAMGIESPPALHKGFDSNLDAFVLSPRIDTMSFTGTGGKGTVQLKVKPVVRETQRIAVLLNEFNPAANTVPRAYSFQTTAMSQLSPPGPTETLNIPVTGIVPGVYLVRVQIDGAESALGTDSSFNFVSPQLTIV
jgi:hypothetical protein